MHLTPCYETKSFDFLGTDLSNEIARGIAEGCLDPCTKQPFSSLASKNFKAQRVSECAFKRLMQSTLKQHEKTELCRKRKKPEVVDDPIECEEPNRFSKYVFSP